MATTPTRTGWWTRNTIPWGDRSVIALAPPSAATAVAPAPTTIVGMPAVPAAIATAVAPEPSIAVGPVAPPAAATAAAPAPATTVGVTAPPAVATVVAPEPGVLTGNDVIAPAPPAGATAIAPAPPAVTVTAPAPVAVATAVAPAPATAVTLPTSPPANATAVAPAPTMTAANHISPVSSAYAAADTVAMPAHQAGDFIFVFVSRRAGSGTPALNAGWTNITNANRAVGTGNWSARLAYKVAASSSETVGTWANADDVLVLVYRGIIGLAFATNIGAANKTVTWPAMALQGTNGQSWVLRFARGGGAASLTSDLLTNPISGYSFIAGNDFVLAIGSGGPVSSAPVAQTQITNNTNYWFAVTLELRSAD